jgi:tetratricopeptide (TPR) repeat protein
MNAARRVCFMIMPYGTKSTDAVPGTGVPAINFDALWDRALRPAIEQLGYEPVRADQDVGSLIIHEMIERLYFSDLVLAEMTIPNGNVYYEVGIRHACKGTGCVLLAADWSRQLFDVAQMRTVRYPLAATEVDAAAGQAIKDVILQRVPPLVAGSSPMYDVLPGYPDDVDPARAKVMRRQLEVLSEFQMRTSQLRVAPREARAQMTKKLLADYGNSADMPPAIVHGLLKLFENAGEWQCILDLVATLPPASARQPNITELTNLAKSKLGNHVEAIAALEALIRESGPTSEREGLLGGRYKKLAAQATGVDKQRHLNNAIKHYEAGMMLDLNDYYPSSNLPRLYRQRAFKGDAEKATATAQAVYFACQRARQRGTPDDWLKPTLLGAAFDAGDVDAAEGLYQDILQEDPVAWKLETTINDLETSLQYVPDQSKRAALSELLQKMRALIS